MGLRLGATVINRLELEKLSDDSHLASEGSASTNVHHHINPKVKNTGNVCRLFVTFVETSYLRVYVNKNTNCN